MIQKIITSLTAACIALLQVPTEIDEYVIGYSFSARAVTIILSGANRAEVNEIMLTNGWKKEYEGDVVGYDNDGHPLEIEFVETIRVQQNQQVVFNG